MEKTTIERITQEYDNECTRYNSFATAFQRLISELLNASNVRVHSVTCRAKDRSSLLNKLQKADSTYDRLSEVTDLAGIRVITYFSDEIDQVADIVASEFQVDQANSVDKRALLDPDRFGYLSLHYVVKLSVHRRKLPEYKQFANCKAEIQIRSILQHAWAEIEHDLGYKSKLAVPRQIQRGFFQMASVLELADTEFTRLRDDLKSYKSSVTAQIDANAASVFVDAVSLGAFVTDSGLVKSIDDAIASSNKSKIKDDIALTDLDIFRLHFSGFDSIGKIQDGLSRFREVLPKFALHFTGLRMTSAYPRGISVFYLVYVKLAQSRSTMKLAQMFRTFEKFPVVDGKRVYPRAKSSYRPEDVAARVLIAYEKAMSA